MSKQENHLLEEALRLPERERAELAARLLESLEPPSEADVEASWSAEIQQRLEELDRGHVQPVPWSEARRRILEDIAESVADLPHCVGERLQD